MKTILIAIDYSKNAISALKYAYQLSVKTSSKLWVIHIYDLSSLISDIDETYLMPYEDTSALKNKTLKDFCKKQLGSNYNTSHIKTKAFESTSVVKGIIKISNDVNASIIVMGMKGNSVIKDLIMGSNTNKILGKSPCPVLAIPTTSNTTKIENIVYTTDYEEEDIGAISKLTKLLINYNPSIKIVHISSKKNKESELEMEWFKEMLEQKVTYKKLEFILLYSETIYKTLKTYLDETNVDLIAMLERSKKSFSQKIFHKDLVKKIEESINIPLLSFNEKNY